MMPITMIMGAAFELLTDLLKIEQLYLKLLCADKWLTQGEKERCWQEISRIAAENAAKPEIQGVADRGVL